MFTRKSTFRDVMDYPGLSKYQKYYFDAPIEGGGVFVSTSGGFNGDIF